MTAPDDASALDVLDVSLVVIDLHDFHIRAISRNATDYLGLAATAVVGHSALSVPMAERDRQRAERALVALRDKVIDFFRSSYTLFRADGTSVTVWEWVRAVTLGGERVALAEGTPGTEPQSSLLAQYLGREPNVMAIGTVDADWTVTSVSSEVSALVGALPGECIGWRLVSSVVPEDVHHLLDAGALASGDRAVGLRVRLRGRDGAPRSLYCVLASLAGSGERLVVLMPDVEPPAARSSDRAVQLEAHLLRIANELEASGVLQRVGQVPDASRFPQMQSLTVRQWEILTRLLRGERVPTIASELFVSQSTVRNHLSAIFERFGVHSQPELLALLRRKD